MEKTEKNKLYMNLIIEKKNEKKDENRRERTCFCSDETEDNQTDFFKSFQSQCIKETQLSMLFANQSALKLVTV